MAFGIYVHIPFCRHRCDYCAFATYSDRDHLISRYVDACVAEIEQATTNDEVPEASSVFFGGGTPSRLEPCQLVRILAALPVASDAEVTVECNPEDASAERFATYREAGVTRVSFGAQSFQPHVLRSLGRRHDPSAVRRAVALVTRADFLSWNLDLIFGAVGESDDDWRQTLSSVLSLPEPPPHLSCYALTPEPGTPLGRNRARHPDEDALARRYQMADEMLSQTGYRWEEISNWALAGHECRHNQLYWRQGDYRGFGSAAHSHRSGRRWWNVRTPDRYIEAIAAGRSPVGGAEVLTESERRFEALTLALRTPVGVPLQALDLDDQALVGQGASKGRRRAPLAGPANLSVGTSTPLVEARQGRAVLTVRGRLLANEVAARLQT